MDKDVDMKQVSKSGNGLLHAAVNTGSTDIVRLLLEAGADVNQKNVECDDVMPLHLAIMQGKLILGSYVSELLVTRKRYLRRGGSV